MTLLHLPTFVFRSLIDFAQDCPSLSALQLLQLVSPFWAFSVHPMTESLCYLCVCWVLLAMCARHTVCDASINKLMRSKKVEDSSESLDSENLRFTAGQMSACFVE